MVELRAFAFIDQLQKQLVGYIGSTARGYYPIAGQAAIFMEIAPGIEINSITDAVLKKANVMPGAMVVERTYGMLEVHADSPADVKEAGDVVLDYLGMQEKDRLKPKILAAETIERTDPYMSQIVNRFRAASMMIVDDTLYILECLPAGYAGYAANQAEKAADIKLIHVTVFGASGRVYLSGTTSAVQAAKEAAEQSLLALDGKDH
ncbi:MAG: BMC domain-containing protein [Desulfobacterales bacterium]|jgi:ethanolamine utilization microcompartment shell protein EutL